MYWEVNESIDFQSVLLGEMYEPLRQLSVFEQVKIHPEVHTLVWPNGADFDRPWCATGFKPSASKANVAKWVTVPV